MDILDKSSDPDTLSHTQVGLETGREYEFQVLAVNFNGRTQLAGERLTIITCGVPRLID